MFRKFKIQKKYKTKGLSQSSIKQVLLSRLMAYEIKQKKSRETTILIN